MKNLSKFQLIITGVFAAFLIIGVFIFAFSKGKSEQKYSVLIWGTLRSDVFQRVLAIPNILPVKTTTVTYEEKNPADFDRDFVEALASGGGPDLILVPHEIITRHGGKLYAIPYESFSERNFRDRYAEASELFLAPAGVIAVPLAIDPLVMYWNRDILSNASLTAPPKEWAEFYGLSQTLTKKDGALNITRSVAALGEYRNIRNAKEIISTLILQAGNPITLHFESGAASVLSETMQKSVPPTQSALTFYTEFSNPAKPYYSWNRSLPDSQDYFLAGDSAFYFGFGSELPTLRLKNPNLNFDIAPIPQAQSGERVTTFGRVLAFALPKNSKNLAAAFQVAFALSDGAGATALVEGFGAAPARRNLLGKRPTDPFQTVLFESAISARGWFDPNALETSRIFQTMIESITGGRARIDQAVKLADEEMDGLF